MAISLPGAVSVIDDLLAGPVPMDGPTHREADDDTARAVSSVVIPDPDDDWNDAPDCSKGEYSKEELAAVLRSRSRPWTTRGTPSPMRRSGMR